MKHFLICIAIIWVAALGAMILTAADYPPTLQGSTTLQFLPASTNSTNFIIGIDNYKYHTFVLQNTGGSNTMTLSYTLDLTNYVPFITNAFTAAGTVSTQLTGHFQGFRSITALNGGATNVTNSTEYNAGN